MLKALNSFIDWLEGFVMVAVMSIATVVTVVQVVYRYGFNSSLFWAEEVVIYSIICMSFVGASMGVRHGAHISVDVLNALVPPVVNRWLHIIACVLGMVFAGFLMYFGFQLFLSALDRGQLSSALRFPVAWFYLPIGLSGVLLMIRYLGLVKEIWSKPPVSHSEELASDVDNFA